MRLREMACHDLEQVMDIEGLSFSDPWSRESFVSSMKEPAAVLLVGENEETRLVGYCCLYAVQDEGEIVNVAISPEFRRRGYGAALVKGLMKLGEERGVQNFFLEVRAGNDAGRALYSGLGFEVCGIRKGFYSNPKEDGIVMRRHRTD